MFELAMEVFSNVVARKFGWKKWAAVVLLLVVVPVIALVLLQI